MVAGVGVSEGVPESESEVVALAGDAEDAAAVAVVSCFVDARWDVLRADGALAQVQAAQGRSTGKDDAAVSWVEGDQLVLGGSEEAVSCWGPLGEVGLGDNVVALTVEGGVHAGGKNDRNELVRLRSSREVRLAGDDAGFDYGAVDRREGARFGVAAQQTLVFDAA